MADEIVNNCVYCGKQPKIVRVDGIYYVQCCTPRYCNQVNRTKYSFCGLRKENAIDAWNTANNPIYVTRLGKTKYTMDGKPTNVREMAKAISVSIDYIYALFRKNGNVVVYKDHVLMRQNKRGVIL